MIYEFLTNKTLGIFINAMSDLTNMTNLNLIEYRILEYHTLKHNEKSVKRFVFGYEGNTFNFYLSESDTIGFDFSDNRMHYTIEFKSFRISHSGNSTNNDKVDDVKKYLISTVRNYKINQVI